MTQIYTQLLNPVATVRTVSSEPVQMSTGSRQKCVIGLLDNSKPNVNFFLEDLEEELRCRDGYDIVHVRKARSAAPCSEIARIATECEYVINAVAD
jgi:hypothetical protein